MAKTKSVRLGDLIDDPSYSDSQLGQVVRLLTTEGAEQGKEGYLEGYKAGLRQGGEDGYSEGYDHGYGDAAQDTHVHRVYVAIWAADNAPLDLGTTLRVAAVATDESQAMLLAEAYRQDKQSGQGSVFVLDFPLKYPT